MRVRLCDVNPDVRFAAARRLARLENDPEIRDELFDAAAKPSDTWYVISDEAARGVEHLLSSCQPDIVRSATRTGVLDAGRHPADRPLEQA